MAFGIDTMISGLIGQQLWPGSTGSKPQPIGVGPNRYQQASEAYSGLPQMVGNEANVIQSQLAGQLTPAALAQLQNTAASWGWRSGSPMSPLNQNQWDLSRINASMGLQQQGVQNANTFQAALENAMIDPGLNTSVASWNSVARSLPDPQQAYLASLFQNMAGQFDVANPSSWMNLEI